MSYAPALPLSGYAGWKLLQRTMATQTAAFNASPEIKSDEAYFRARIGKIETAEQLVADRRLLKVALGAFGLSEDINSKYFIRKVLEDGTLKTGALANKLSDKRYAALANAFGFHLSTPRTKLSDFADEIMTAYKSRSFEEAVGEQDENMRLALNATRELKALAGKSSSENTKWYTILGSTPLVSVFRTALGLPKAFSQLDVDQQLTMIKDKAASQLGNSTIAQFKDEAAVEKLVQRFLIRSEVASYSTGASSAQNALTLLQNAYWS